MDAVATLIVELDLEVDGAEVEGVLGRLRTRDVLIRHADLPQSLARLQAINI